MKKIFQNWWQQRFAVEEPSDTIRHNMRMLEQEIDLMNAHLGKVRAMVNNCAGV